MKWYYAEAGQQRGPVEEEEFRQLTATGTIRPDTLVWREGMAGWQQWAELSGPPPIAPVVAVAEVPPAATELQAETQPAATRPEDAAKFCSLCGNAYSPQALAAIGDKLVCVNCKPSFLQSMREGRQTVGLKRFGGFWIRFWARCIDSILTGIVTAIIQFSGLAAIGLRTIENDDLVSTMSIFAFSTLFGLAFQLAYEVYFLVNHGATPGKILLNLKVIRSDGGPITAGRAVGRFFGTMLSSMTLSIGYIIAGVDEEKRALHDHLCDTRVIRTN